MSQEQTIKTTVKPEYLCQKRRGLPDRAYIRIDGRKHYLGQWNSSESLRAYARLLTELASGSIVSVKSDEKISIIELCSHYYKWAKQYYGNGAELNLIKGVITVLGDLYGDIPAESFSPLKLEAVTQAFVEKGLTREGCNRRMKRIRYMFKWGVSKELIPPEVFHGLQCVNGLKRGRTKAPETEPRLPARMDHIEAVKPYLLPVLADALELLLLTGGRPGEVLGLRIKDIVTSNSDVWYSKLDRHKTMNKGKERFLYYGPKSQEIIKRRMAGKSFEDYLFSPKEAIAERAAKFDTHRRPKQKPNRRKTNRTINECYDPKIFYRALQRACKQAEDHRVNELAKAKEGGLQRVVASLEKMGEVKFSPYQVRHTAATYIRAKYGLEAARAVLGHETPDMTLIYAERDEETVKNVMRMIG